MKKKSSNDIITLYESIIADKNVDPEKQKRAAHLLQKFRELDAYHEQMIQCFKLIDPNEPEFNELLLQESDNLVHKIAHLTFYLSSAVNPAKTTFYKNQSEIYVQLHLMLTNFYRKI